MKLINPGLLGVFLVLLWSNTVLISVHAMDIISEGRSGVAFLHESIGQGVLPGRLPAVFAETDSRWKNFLSTDGRDIINRYYG